jgi:hypothetical protein
MTKVERASQTKAGAQGLTATAIGCVILLWSRGGSAINICSCEWTMLVLRVAQRSAHPVLWYSTALYEGWYSMSL